eukprot:COSAG03_NODE_22633_length_288_cov_1.597884_1_plen_78_part_10
MKIRYFLNFSTFVPPKGTVLSVVVRCARAARTRAVIRYKIVSLARARPAALKAARCVYALADGSPASVRTCRRTTDAR